MKTMLTLVAMILVGNAFAGVDISSVPSLNPTFDIRKCDITPGAVIPPSSPAPVSQASPETYQSSKVEYSLITLPDGTTASVLTFK